MFFLVEWMKMSFYLIWVCENFSGDLPTCENCASWSNPSVCNILQTHHYLPWAIGHCIQQWIMWICGKYRITRVGSRAWGRLEKTRKILDCLLPYCPRCSSSAQHGITPSSMEASSVPFHSVSSTFGVVALILSPMQATLAISLDSTEAHTIHHGLVSLPKFQVVL